MQVPQTCLQEYFGTSPFFISIIVFLIEKQLLYFSKFVTWVDRWELGVHSEGLSRGSLYFEYSSKTDLLSIRVIELFFTHFVVLDSLHTHRLQHTRLPYPSLSPRVCSNSYPLSQWCHPTISSSVSPFSCPQSFPASASFPISWLFAWGGQSITASASVSVLSVNIQDWFPWGLTGLIFL